MFNPLSFLSLAEKLNSTGFVDPKDEATLRTIVGRAYYAAHLYVREKLRRYFPSQLTDTYLRKEKVSEHRKVEELLTKKNLYFIAEKHYELFELRVKADYKLQDPVGSGDVNKSFTLAKNIIQLTNRHL